MSLNNPVLGPVLGHVTGSSARLWSGIQQGPEGVVKAICGRLRYRALNASDDVEAAEWSSVISFRYNMNFYWTGVVELTGLSPGQQYEYQLGYIPDCRDLDDELLDWSLVACHKFYTFEPKSKFRFALGSCMRNDVFCDRTDKVFRTIQALHHRPEERLDLMLFMGDQIYNDPLMGFTTNDWSKEDFSDRYATFFNYPRLKPLLAELPNYMVMDDHEIANDFVSGADEYAEGFLNNFTHHRSRIINGITAFYAYQASHSPIFDKTLQQGSAAFIKGQGNYNVPVKHHYSLDFDDVGFYVLDTRLERNADEMLSQQQEQALIDFLMSPNYRVKFVVSAVTFLADKTKEKAKKADNWKRFHKQRKRLLRIILEQEIKNVVFLSGDVHSSFVCQLQHEGIDLPVYQIVSSAIFWPTSFLMNRIRWFEEDVAFNKDIYGSSNCQLKGPLADEGDRLETFYAGNGVGVIELNNSELLFRVYDSEQEDNVRLQARLSLV